MVLPFLSIYGSEQLGFQPITIGWLLSVYGFGGVVAGLLVGRVIERIGAIPTQILALAFAVPGFLWVGWATDFYGLSISLFYLSVAVEGLRPACTTATVDFCESDSQHVKALAVNRLAVNLGMTLGPALGGFLILLSYQLLFYVNAVSTLAAMILTIAFFGWNFHAKETAAAVDSERVTSESESVNATRSLRNTSPFRDVRFVVFCLLNCLGACVLYQFIGTYPLYLKEQYQFQEHHIGLLYAVNTVIIVLFEMILVHWIAKRSLLKVFAWGQLLSCLGFGLLPFGLLLVDDRTAIAGTTFAMAFAYCSFTMIVLTIGEMFAMPMGPAYAARRSNSLNRGSYMGVFSTSFSVAALLAPLAGMALYEWNPDSVGYASLAVGGVVFFALIALANREGS